MSDYKNKEKNAREEEMSEVEEKDNHNKSNKEDNKANSKTTIKNTPAEMGELFKVLALGKRYSERLIGFANGDRSATL